MKNLLFALLVLLVTEVSRAQVQIANADIGATCKVLKLAIDDSRHRNKTEYIPVLYLTYKYLNDYHSVAAGPTKQFLIKVHTDYTSLIDNLERALSKPVAASQPSTFVSGPTINEPPPSETFNSNP